jgi:hypothetical protein
MWITRATWQRVLQLSKRSLLPLLLLTAVSLLYGEEAPALLVRGPLRLRGIDLLAPNALVAFEGFYSYKEEEIRVIFTSDAPLRSGDWLSLSCGKLQLFKLPDEWERIFYYSNNRDISLLFVFNPDFDLWCDFITIFVERFSFLLGFSLYEVDVPFPAVLELAAK